MYVVTIANNIISIILTLIILITHNISIKEKNKSTKTFKLLIIINLIVVVACLTSYTIVALRKTGDFFIINGVALFIIFSTPGFFFTILTEYVCSLLPSSDKELHQFYQGLIALSYVATIMNSILAFVIGTKYCTLSVFNIPFNYGLSFFICSMAIIFIVFIAVFKARKFISKKDFFTLITMLVLMILGYILAMLYPDNHLTTISTLSLLFLFMFIQNDRINMGNIENVYRALKTLEKSYAVLEEEKSRVEAVASIFHTMYTLDFENQSIQVHGNTSYTIDKLVREYKSMDIQNTLNAVMTKVTSADYLKNALDFVDLSQLETRMKDKTFITWEGINYHNNWWRFMFIRVGAVNTPLKKVLFTTLYINDEKLKEEYLIRSSKIDELTGIYNRNAYIANTKEIQINDRLCYIGVDLNGLKAANDTLGHEAGDEILVATGNILRECCGDFGLVYRTGGDEFVAILDADENIFRQILSDIQEKQNKWKGTLNDHLSFSIGCVRASELENPDFSMISKLADKRMYENKHNFYVQNKNLDRRER